MRNCDITETQFMLKMAREFVEHSNIDRNRVLATLPHRTLLLDFVTLAANMTSQQLAKAFPLLTRHIDLVHNNNPLDFDWERLALAVDNVHGHYVGSSAFTLNT